MHFWKKKKRIIETWNCAEEKNCKFNKIISERVPPIHLQFKSHNYPFIVVIPFPYLSQPLIFEKTFYLKIKENKIFRKNLYQFLCYSLQLIKNWCVVEIQIKPAFILRFRIRTTSYQGPPLRMAPLRRQPPPRPPIYTHKCLFNFTPFAWPPFSFTQEIKSHTYIRSRPCHQPTPLKFPARNLPSRSPQSI